MRDIGKNIKKLRLKNKITQEQLAESLHVTRQTISNYETGRSYPDIDMLVNIADIYQIDVDRLIYGDDFMGHDFAKSKIQGVICSVIYIIVASTFIICFQGFIRDYTVRTFDGIWQILFVFAIRPLLSIGIGMACMEILTRFIHIRVIKRNSKPRLSAWIIGITAAAVVIIIVMMIGKLLFHTGGNVSATDSETWSFVWIILTTINTEHWYVFIMLGMCIAYLVKLLRGHVENKKRD